MPSIAFDTIYSPPGSSVGSYFTNPTSDGIHYESPGTFNITAGRTLVAALRWGATGDDETVTVTDTGGNVYTKIGDDATSGVPTKTSLWFVSNAVAKVGATLRVEIRKTDGSASGAGAISGVVAQYVVSGTISLQSWSFGHLTTGSPYPVCLTGPVTSSTTDGAIVAFLSGDEVDLTYQVDPTTGSGIPTGTTGAGWNQRFPVLPATTGGNDGYFDSIRTAVINEAVAGKILDLGGFNHTISIIVATLGVADTSGVIPSSPPADPGCSGGGVIPIDADPSDGPPFSGRLLGPRWWLTLGYDDVDRSLALDSGNHPPGSGGRKIGNLIRGGTIKRALSNRTTPYQMGEADVDADDSGRLLSTLEATATSEYWANRETRINLSDLNAIATSVTPWTLFRGIWRTHDSTGLARHLAMTSVLGSDFSDFNLERTIPDLQIKDVCPDAPKDSLEKYLPFAYGIFPDPAYAGSGDPVTGVNVTVQPRPAAPTGLTATFSTGGALFAAGDFRNIANGETLWYAVTAYVDGLESDPAYVSLTATAADGHVDLAWDAYASATGMNVYVAYRSDFLQFSQLMQGLSGGTVVFTDKTGGIRGPDINILDVWSIGLRMTVRWDVYAQLASGYLSAPGRSEDVVFTPIRNAMRRRDMTVTWDAYPGAVKYFALRHVVLYTDWDPRYDLQLTTIPPSTTVVDTNNDDALIAGGFADAPGVVVQDSQGCVPAIPAGKETIGGVSYNRLLLSIGAWRHVETIRVTRASTQGSGTTTTSTDTAYDRVPESDYGTVWLAPGKTGWPYPNNYVEYNGVWCQPVFTTLDPLPTTVLVDGCAITDIPDGTGSTIDGAARIFFHLLQQHILPPADEAWRSGSYLSPRTFTDGTPVVNTASVAALEAIETNRIGGYYRGQVYIDQSISLRDLLTRVFVSWGIRVGENEHGQLIGKHFDDFTDLASAPHLTDRADIVGPTQINRRIEELENYIVYDYGYRPAATGSFLQQNQVAQSAMAIAANRGRRAVGDHRQMYFADDPVTVASVIAHDLAFGQLPPVYVTVPITLEAWFRNYGTGTSPRFLKLGDVFLVDDVDGIGATGWTSRPLWLLEVDIALNDLQTAPVVTLIAVDVKRILDSYGLWATDSVADWGSATADDKATDVFWTNDDGTMSDGSTGKVWN